MKLLKTFCAAACGVCGVACAAPMETVTANWDVNPLVWHSDEATRTIRSVGNMGLVSYNAPRSANVHISASVTPQKAGTNGWAVIGVAMADDNQNFWHAALVQAPPDIENGRRLFELTEMREGAWLAQIKDKLKVTHQRQNGVWDYGETYEISLTSTPSGISAAVKNKKGEAVWEIGYAYPKPDENGKVRAVTCGRPALNVNGSFCGVFANLDATWSETREKESSAVIPPYVSDSFVRGVTDKATGFFRVVQKDGRWHAIDPLGRGVVLLGIDHVTYHGHYSRRTQRSIHHEVNKVKFPNKTDREEDTLKRLKAWGFNMLGAGCDVNLKHRGLIHTIFLSIGDGMCWDTNDPELYICPNEHRPCSAFPNVFHPDFAKWADYVARKKCAPHKNDPWLFGYFIDNELSWWGRGRLDTGLFNAVEALPDTHSAKIAQKKFLRERGITGNASDEVKLDFLKLAADIYFRVSSEAVRRHDPNHLVMGARFAGITGAHPAVWEASGRYCDLVTFNFYPWADLDRNVVFTHRAKKADRITDAFAKQYELVKKPMLITEWSFPALDSGLPCTGGAGQRFKTQKERTKATELFARTMLAMPFLLGYDYFMWVDEPAAGISDAFPEDSNYGLINEQGKAYPEITEMFARIHGDIAKVIAEGKPKECEAPANHNGITANEFKKIHPAGGAVYSRDGNRYVVKNSAGLELAGRIGGSRMFETVKVNGKLLGEYSGMWNDVVNETLAWHEAGKVVSAEWREESGTLFVTCEGWSSKTRGMRQTHAITVYANKPWFLCELTSAKNVGSEAVEINSFYFREYSPFAFDRAKSKPKVVPNLWKGDTKDAWVSADRKLYYGGFSLAPTIMMFSYHLMNDGKSQHPDAMFGPPEKLVMQPGGVYEPKGTIWMLAVCGDDGEFNCPTASSLTNQDFVSLEKAIDELGEKFKGTYPAAELRKELERMKFRETFADEIEKFKRRALVQENPLVNAHEIVYTTRAQWRGDHHNTATIFQCGEINQNSYCTQGALKALDVKSGSVRVIVPEEAGRTVRDPEVDYDGRRIVFSMRNGKTDDYHICVVNADGSGLKQLTRAKGVSDIDPVWLPDGDIVFGSTREPKYCMCNRHIMCNLFRMKPDGANIHQIGKSTLFEGHPTVLGDGRILYDRWEYVDRNFGDAQGLWVCNPDGTRHAIYWGNNTTSPGGVINARALSSSSQVIATLGSCHDLPWGALAVIDRTRGVDGREPVLRTWPAEYRERIHTDREDFDSTKKIALKYADPFPLDDGHFICTRMVAEGSREMAVVYLDLHGNEVVFHRDAPGCHSPVVLRKAKKPVVQSEQRNFERPDAPGRFYVQNVYEGTHMKGVKKGTIKALRVVESPEKRSWIRVRGWFGHGEEAAAMNWHSFENKRILGTVPVESDGSAYFEVPGNTFVYFQALDADGKMVQSMRSGTYLQPGESYGCVGCHENRTGDVPKTEKKPLALLRAPSKLDGGYNLRGLEKGTAAHLYSFQKEVQPVFSAKCAACHDYGKPAGEKLNLSGDRGAYFCTSYVDLHAKGYVRCVGGGPAEIQQAYSWGSHASPLTKKLYGHGGVKLTDDERARVITWMDVNAPYWPCYECAWPQNYGGRMPITRDEHDKLQMLTGVKIATGHVGRQREQLNFDRPGFSRILSSVNDSQKRAAALEIISAGAERLKTNPRADMDGFVPCDADRELEERYLRRLNEESNVYDAIRRKTRRYDE